MKVALKNGKKIILLQDASRITGVAALALQTWMNGNYFSMDNSGNYRTLSRSEWREILLEAFDIAIENHNITFFRTQLEEEKTK